MVGILKWLSGWVFLRKREWGKQDRADEKAKQECDFAGVSLKPNPTGMLKHKLHHKTGCTSRQAAAAATKSRQSCPTLCDPKDSSPLGSSVPGILQARILEWVAISSPMHENVRWRWSRSVMSDSSWPHGLQPTRLLRPHPWDFPSKSTGVSCHCLLHLKARGLAFYALSFSLAKVWPRWGAGKRNKG